MHTRTQTRTHRLIPTHAGKTGPNAGVWSVSWAHPHSRGENCKGIDRAGRDNGSSPLTRGKHYPHPKTRSDRRLIPTHAGKTCLPVRRRRGPEAHPHSRGENRLRARRLRSPPGSSPLTRGKPTKTPKRLGPRRAHPHSRGENAPSGATAVRLRGSSPLTRGKLGQDPITQHQNGLIPTHAGKTRTDLLRSYTNGAHPHSRGENDNAEYFTACSGGSSPLTRGKRVPVRGEALENGLIPTHAGKTWRPTPRLSPPWAHPHSRGENCDLEGHPR